MYIHVLYGAAEPPYKGRLRSFHDDDDNDEMSFYVRDNL